jgi:hypothetical protein
MRTTVDVRFDSAHLYLDLADGRAVEFPLDCFPVLEAATDDERTHFAISLDQEQFFWPELDEDMNVPALLAWQLARLATACDSAVGA